MRNAYSLKRIIWVDSDESDVSEMFVGKSVLFVVEKEAGSYSVYSTYGEVDYKGTFATLREAKIESVKMFYQNFVEPFFDDIPENVEFL